MMAMYNPPHPGAILKEDVLPELGLGVTEAARQLGVSRVALSRVINGKAAISADMALRLEAWMNGPTAQSWLRMQADYDLWQARQKPAPKVERIAA
ncbi:MAG: HigA family addiction module antitoxin [Methylococcaceae bacterium]|nr:HigA family addiction module antitoxin [Methylococcaceae bacterium]